MMFFDPKIGLTAFVVLNGFFLPTIASPSTPKSERPRFDLTPGSFTLPLKHNTNFTRDGRRAYAHALAKWGMKAPLELTKALEDASTPQEDLNAFSSGGRILTWISIGTPPQEVVVKIDAGSPDLWVYTPRTNNGSGLGWRPTYDPGESSSASKMDTDWRGVQYEDGTWAEGSLFTDNVSITTTTVENAPVGIAVWAAYSLFFSPSLGGVLGLSIDNTNYGASGFLKNLMSSAPAPVFAVDLQYEGEGALTVGAESTNQYLGDKHTIPCDTSLWEWQITFNGFRFGNSETWSFGNYSAILDTVTTLLLLAPEIVDAYYNQVPEARFVYGSWTYPCASRMPALSLGWPSTTADPGGFSVDIPGHYLNYSTAVTPGYGMGGLQRTPVDGLAILGDVFLMAVYAVFHYDTENPYITLATKDLITLKG